MHKEVAMTLRRLVLFSLLGAFLVMAGATLASAGADSGNPVPRYLEPAPWWWLGPKGDTYRAVIAGRPHGQFDGIKLPPEVKPVDPVSTSPTRSSESSRGPAAASKSSLSGSLSAPGSASMTNAPGSLTLATRASSAPARPDPRDVRRELEAAHRALGL
jgi:hypothetical protein